MKNASPLFIKITSRTAVVIGLALGIMLIPNLAIFDEALSPEITQLLANPASPELQGNAAIDLYGLAAASHLDMQQVGTAFMKTLRDKHAQGESVHLSDQETTQLMGGADFDAPWQKLYPTATGCNPREHNNCFEKLLAEVKAIPISHERLRAQLQRYGLIIQRPNFSEEIRSRDMSTPPPNFFLMLQLGRLSNANAYQNQALDGLINTARAKMKFERLMLTESQTLLSRMVAIVALRGDLLSLSYAIRQSAALSDTQIQNLQALLHPLTPEELNSERVFTAELYSLANNSKEYFAFKNNTQPWFFGLLTQPTASTNLHYRQALKPVFALAKMSPSEFYERAQTPLKPAEFSRINPYNLTGKIGLSSVPQYAEYISRSHDLNGIYGLLAVQLALKIQAPQDIATAIKTSPYKTPYTAQAFDYDAASNTLGFSCFDVQSECSIKL